MGLSRTDWDDFEGARPFLWGLVGPDEALPLATGGGTSHHSGDSSARRSANKAEWPGMGGFGGQEREQASALSLESRHLEEEISLWGSFFRSLLGRSSAGQNAVLWAGYC